LEISSFERVSQFLDLTLTAGTSLILFCGTTFSTKFQIEKNKKSSKSLLLWQGGNLLKLHKTLSKNTIRAANRGGGSKKSRGKTIAELHGEEEMKEDGVQFRYLDFYY
jgi:hypothetical protein